MRKDFTELPFVTIDGAGTEDIDDAVYCEKTDNGYKVYVAISDVTKHVKPGSPEDRQAQFRGTSTYYAHGVKHMFNREFSEQKFSLRENVERDVFVCIYEIDMNTNKVTDYEFTEAVIVNRKETLYTDAEKAIDAQEGMIYDLYKVSCALNKNRTDNGAINMNKKNFNMKVNLYIKPEIRELIKFSEYDSEVLFGLDDSQIAYKTDYRLGTTAENMIAELMIMANSCAAEEIIKISPDSFLLKTHQQLSDDDFDDIIKEAQRNGVKIKKKDIQNGFENFIGSYKVLLDNLLIEKMRQASYSSKNEGHFGVGMSHYTHFTSPIRRYPDIIVHRLLKGEDVRLTEEDIKHLNDTRNFARSEERKISEMFQTKYMIDKKKGLVNGTVIRIITNSKEVNGKVIDFTDYVIRTEEGFEFYIRGLDFKKQPKIADKVTFKITDARISRRNNRCEKKFKQVLNSGKQKKRK